jgi:hypothetical protein
VQTHAGGRSQQERYGKKQWKDTKLLIGKMKLPIFPIFPRHAPAPAMRDRAPLHPLLYFQWPARRAIVFFIVFTMSRAIEPGAGRIGPCIFPVFSGRE